MKGKAMRNVLLAAVVLVSGCSEPKTVTTKPAAAAASWIGKAVIVKPGKDSISSGLVMVAPPGDSSEFFAASEIQAFRGVILDETPDVYHEGRIDDWARWLVKVEDGQFAGRVVTVVKKRVDLMPVK